MEKPLLIFDLDETLIYATKSVLESSPDFSFDAYAIYIRPHATTVLRSLSSYFDIAIWSSAGDDYVEYVSRIIQPDDIEFAFVWGYSRCTVKYNLELGGYYPLKNLKKAKKRGYSLEQMLIVDNTPSKVQANYGNAVYIKDFNGEESDAELLRLKDFLIKIHSAPNYRSIEKRHWLKNFRQSCFQMKMTSIALPGLLRIMPWLLLTTLAGACNPPQKEKASKDLVYQYGTIKALLEGHYDGDMNFEALGQKGDFGIGTFNALDGEMLGFNGQFYQVRSDGSVHKVPDSMKTPFAVVTHFDVDTTFQFSWAIGFERMQQLLDGIIPTENQFYAIRMDGRFTGLKTRSVTAQSPPYRPLGEVVNEQSIFDFEEIQGIMVAFRFPQYTDEINVPGYHFHFISEDLKHGGHVLGFEKMSATISVDYLSDLHLSLPKGDAFQNLDLGKDRSEDLEKVEKLRN